MGYVKTSILDSIIDKDQYYYILLKNRSQAKRSMYLFLETLFVLLDFSTQITTYRKVFNK